MAITFKGKPVMTVHECHADDLFSVASLVAAGQKAVVGRSAQAKVIIDQDLYDRHWRINENTWEFWSSQPASRVGYHFSCFKQAVALIGGAKSSELLRQAPEALRRYLEQPAEALDHEVSEAGIFVVIEGVRTNIVLAVTPENDCFVIDVVNESLMAEIEGSVKPRLTTHLPPNIQFFPYSLVWHGQAGLDFAEFLEDGKTPADLVVERLSKWFWEVFSPGLEDPFILRTAHHPPLRKLQQLVVDQFEEELEGRVNCRNGDLAEMKAVVRAMLGVVAAAERGRKPEVAASLRAEDLWQWGGTFTCQIVAEGAGQVARAVYDGPGATAAGEVLAVIIGHFEPSGSFVSRVETNRVSGLVYSPIGIDLSLEWFLEETGHEVVAQVKRLKDFMAETAGYEEGAIREMIQGLQVPSAADLAA